MKLNWSLKTKLLGLCAVLSLFILFVGLTSYRGLKGVTANFKHVAEINFPNSTNLGIMRFEVSRIQARLMRLASSEYTKAEKDKLLASITDNITHFEKANEIYKAVPFVDGEEEKYKPIEQTWEKIKTLKQQIEADYHKAWAASPTSPNASSDLKIKPMSDLCNDFYNAIDNMIAFQDGEAKKWTTIALSEADRTDHTIFALSLLAVTFGMAVGYILARNISSTLQRLTETLRHTSEEVASASMQMSSTSEELSASTAEQSSSLQETSASIEEMSAMISRNAESAKRSGETACASETIAHQGKESTSEMLNAILEINEANARIMHEVERSNKELTEIVQVISDISAKTRVINDIVFQTKLLSFNASVEAARAGEQGKGFAVVAEEVGNLAQMSGNAAKEIFEMLESSISKVEGIVTTTKSNVEGLISTGKDKIETGTQKARHCAETLEQLVEKVVLVNQLVQEITTASQEQSQGVKEITKAMTQLDQVTQQNAAASQQSATASGQLSNQAERLRTSIQQLDTLVRGSNEDPRIEAASSKPLPDSSAKTVPLQNDQRFQDSF
ncbi:MAG: methyl-accepting chemotaxis protein [Bdellovibrionia bacterium]